MTSLLVLGLLIFGFLFGRLLCDLTHHLDLDRRRR